jgi:invasion protein IalB
LARNRIVIAAAIVAVLVAGAAAVYLLRAPLGLSGGPAPAGKTISGAPPAALRMPVPQPVAEQFDKWRVQCVQDAESRQLCRAEQVIVGTDGVPQLAVFATAPAAGRPAQVVIVPPWAVLIDRGLTLQVDAQPRFSVPIVSCQPSGCWSDFPLGDALLGQLRQGTTLQVAVIAADGGPMVIAVPLAGFGPAYERLLQSGPR